MNHCIHGIELNVYCPTCELDVLDFASWLNVPLTCIPYLDSFEICEELLIACNN